MSVIGSNVLAGASNAGALTVERSYNFNSAAFTAFTRSISTSSSGFNVSVWLKGATQTAANQAIISRTWSTGDFLNYGRIYFDSTRRLRYTEIYAGVTTVDVYLPGPSADSSAWTHYFIAVDASVAGAVANRCKVYINGVLQTLDAASVFAQFAAINMTRGNAVFGVGTGHSSALTDLLKGFGMTELTFLATTQVTPGVFGTTNSANQWVPVSYRGTYPAGSFYLKFNDATSATTLGYDSSGLGNNFTPTGITTASSSFDTPTPNSTRGNYAVWDFNTQSTGISQYTPLTVTTLAAAYTSTTPVHATTFPITAAGKFYAEITCDTANSPAVSVYTPNNSLNPLYGNNNITYQGNGQWYVNGILQGTTTSWGAGAVISVTIDTESSPNVVRFYLNNTLRISASTTSFPTLVPPYHLCVVDTNAGASSQFTANFGQTTFTYTPPTGFNPLNSQYIQQGSMTYSGTFIGNASADGPLVYLNGAPQSLKINGNTVVFGTHARRLANGFKVITANTGYNNTGANIIEVVAGSPTFKYGRGQVS